MLKQRAIARRFLTGLLTAWLVLLMSGAPLPALPRVSKLSTTVGSKASISDSSESAERYPCEACPCGCSTADYCWKSCCCHTLAERITWAKRNDVRPPESALQEAASLGIDVSQWGIKSAPKQKLVAYQLPRKTPKSLPPCCAARLKAAQKEKQQEQTNKSDVANKPGIVLLKALACQGLLEQWLTIGSAPLPPKTSWTPNFQLESVQNESPILYVSLISDLVPPPPEC